MKPYFKIACLLLSLSLPLVLGSCSDDPEPDSDIALVSGSEFTTSSKTVSGGTDLAAKVTARARSEGNQLTRFRILLTYYPAPAEELVYLDSALNSAAFNYVLNFQTRRIAGSENYRFEITDSNGKVKSTGFRLTTTGTNADYYSYSVKLLHPSDSVTKSFLSASGGVVYDKIPVAGEAFQKLADMVFLFNQGDSAILAAPSDRAAESIKQVNLKAWQTRNKTEFKSVSQNVFSSANTRPLVVNAFTDAFGTSTTSITNVQKDSYYAFKIASGKQGILKVANIKNDSTENSVSLDIKIGK